MASKKWKTSSLPFFKSRVKDMPDPLNSPPSGRSVGTDYKMRLMQRKQTGFSGEVPKHRYADELEPQKASQPSDKKGYSHTRSDSAGSLPAGGQTGDLLFLEIRCKQLKDERDNFEQLFMAEQLKNRRMVRRFSTQVVGGIQLDGVQDHASVQKLETQLQGISDRCEALNSNLKEKDAEVEALKDRVRELEANSSASVDLVEQHAKKVKHLREELAKSEADRLRVQMCLDERNLELLSATQKVLHLEGMIAENRAESQEQIMRLKEELAKTEFECFDTNRSLEDKVAEARKLTELVNFLENQVSKAQQKMISIQGEILHLKSDLARSEGTWVESFCQLEQIHGRKIAEWASEKASLLDQMRDIEYQLQGEEVLFGGLLDTDNGFEFKPSIDNGSKLNRSLSLDSHKEAALLASPQRSPAAWWSSPFRSPVRSHGLIQTLLDIGEASLDSVEGEEIQSWKAKLAQVEMRERAAADELKQKTCYLVELENGLARIKAEFTEEKEKAKEEAEDLAQEMAELRYQLMEMLDHERELRARTEQASVHRVEELEAQLKRSRQETVAALARRREFEVRLDEKLAEVISLQLQLKAETCLVNQLRLENQDLQHQCEIKDLELVGFIEHQRASMEAQMRTMGVKNMNSESEETGHSTLVQGCSLSVSDVVAETEADDSMNLTPKSQFVDAGLLLFEEWVKSGCLNVVPEVDMESELVEYEDGESELGEHDMAQHKGEEVAKESTPSNQFQNGSLHEPVVGGDFLLQSKTVDVLLLEAGTCLPDRDQWGQDSSLLADVEGEVPQIEGHHLQGPNTLHGDLVPSGLRDASTDGYGVDVETGDLPVVVSSKAEMASSDNLRENLTATRENAELHVSEERGGCGEDLQAETNSGDIKDNVQQLSFNDGDASTYECEVNLAPRDIDNLPLVESEVDTSSNLQDHMMVAQREAALLVCALQDCPEEEIHVKSALGDTEDNVYQLSEATRKIEKTLEDGSPSLKLSESEGNVENDLQIPNLIALSLESERYCGQLDQPGVMPKSITLAPQDSFFEDSITEDLQAEI